MFFKVVSRLIIEVPSFEVGYKKKAKSLALALANDRALYQS